MLYFEMIDDLGHDYGIDSKELEQGVLKIDSLIDHLKQEVGKTGLPVNYIVVSDHGMQEIDQDRMIDFGKFEHEDATITVSCPVMIYSENQDYLMKCYQDLKKDERLNVFWKDSLPEHYHFNSPDLTGDLVIMPKPDYYPYLGKPSSSVASHCWDPADSPDMGAVFYAEGPAFKEGTITLSPFENIHIYPLITEIFNLEYDSAKIDGRLEVLKPILAE
jgi:predicted AlkP superfamily pyrophosphatase or phosphodiesterase